MENFARNASAAFLLGLSAVVTNPSRAVEAGYEETVAAWTSSSQVADWLKQNYRFDPSRQRQVVEVLNRDGPTRVPTRKPQSLYTLHSGYCRDAAAFGKDALNRINPEHAARLIFIKNRFGQPNHWVTGFTVEGKLYVMDYGAGPEWRALMGVHGPYASLDDYTRFLDSLSIPRFAPERVEWRDLPGQED